MANGLERWDARYRSGDAPAEPSRLLSEFAHLLPHKGHALDVACGAGRNSIFLAENGLAVIGVDFSPAALQLAKARAEEAGVRIDFRLADLEVWVPPENGFDVILCFYYLDRALRPRLRKALRPGGSIWIETYTTAQLQFNPAMNRAYLLEQDELPATFAGWQIMVARDEVVTARTGNPKAIASLIARKPDSDACSNDKEEK